ncbi:MAG: hypothetical protein H3C31_07555 [Brumimicrobium sp.]|nr:hypothetical protein [Brumimicrobium sp.]
MKKYILYISIIILTGCSTISNYTSINYNLYDFSFEAETKKENKPSSSLFEDYYGRYDFYKETYDIRNEVLIPIDIHIWQKDDGTGNYINDSINRADWKKIIEYVERFYNQIEAPSRKVPGVVDYVTTKIHFQLNKVYFTKNSACWKLGQNINAREGEKLNQIADSLYPKGISFLKIHVTGANPRPSGYAVFPEFKESRDHFVVTFNKEQEIHFNGPDATWAKAQHIAHELAHDLDLYHIYSLNFNACDQTKPDYLDDIFGRGENVICPFDTGWDCDYADTIKPCLNNIMGGTKDARYFSPKQVQRMHRALMLKSIGKYAIAYNFNSSNFIEITKDEIWDFDFKTFNNIRIQAGTTLTIKNTIRFIPEAGIYIEEGGKLILDGGILTNEQVLNSKWKGVKIQKNKQTTLKQEDFIEIKNSGKIYGVK